MPHTHSLGNLSLQVLGFLFASSLFAVVNAQYTTAPNTALFYCGRASDGSVNPQAVKAWNFAAKGSKDKKTSPYAGSGQPGYANLITIDMLQAQIVGQGGRLPAAGTVPSPSTLFARGASGIVRLYEDCLSADARTNGVWKQAEEPGLLANLAVTELRVIEPSTGLEYIAWRRIGGAAQVTWYTRVATGTPIWSHADAMDLLVNPGTPLSTPPRRPTPPGTGRPAGTRRRLRRRSMIERGLVAKA